jgi:hypothetical protein
MKSPATEKVTGQVREASDERTEAHSMPGRAAGRRERAETYLLAASANNLLMSSSRACVNGRNTIGRRFSDGLDRVTHARLDLAQHVAIDVLASDLFSVVGEFAVRLLAIHQVRLFHGDDRRGRRRRLISCLARFELRVFGGVFGFADASTWPSFRDR